MISAEINWLSGQVGFRVHCGVTLIRKVGDATLVSKALVSIFLTEIIYKQPNFCLFFSSEEKA